MPTTIPPYLSKTLWTNAIIAAVAFFPGAQAYVTAHPMIVVEVLAGVNIVLRILTKSKLSLS